MKNAAAAWDRGVADEHAQFLRELPLRHLDLGHAGADPVGAHHALGLAGGAAGEIDRGNVLGRNVRRLQRLWLEPRCQRQVVVAHLGGPQGQQVLEGGDPFLKRGRYFAEGGGVEHQGLDLGGFQDIGVIVQGAEGVQGRTDTARELHGGDVGQHFGLVGGDHCNATADAQALGLQCLHQLAGLLAHLAVARNLVAQEQAGLVVVAVEPLDQQVRHQGRLVQCFAGHG